MKKIVLLMMMLMLSVYTSQASAFSFSDMFGGGDDNSAVGAGAGDPNNFNDSGTGYNFNDSGTGSNFNDSGTGSNFNDSPTSPKEQYNTNDKGYSSSLNKNPFSSGSNGVPKLSLMGIVYWLVGLMNQLVYLIIGAALVSFLYGILKLSFIDGHKPEAREQARKFMFWGIVSLFVMMSVWGLVNILKLTLFGPGDLIIPRLK